MISFSKDGEFFLPSPENIGLGLYSGMNALPYLHSLHNMISMSAAKKTFTLNQGVIVERTVFGFSRGHTKHDFHRDNSRAYPL